MREMLEEKLTRFEELEQMMTDPEVLSNSQQMAKVAREHGALAKLATRYRTFKQVANEITEVTSMAESDDPEERELAEMELPELKAKREACWDELLDLTIGGEDVPLSSDGTFRIQVPFRDGNQLYPIEATAADGEQKRNITLNFERVTPEDNTNPASEAQLEWF